MEEWHGTRLHQLLLQGLTLLPVENLHVIDRYIGESGAMVGVDRLGKGSFQKLKSKTKERLLEIASEIVDMAAKREMVEALKIEADSAQMARFEMDAGFIYTEDQRRVVGEIAADGDGAAAGGTALVGGTKRR